MRSLWRNNGLSITLFTLFLVFLIGQALTGWHEQLDELQAHGAASIDFLNYLCSGSFMEVTAENWESEFLQMLIYVVLTVFLFQKGSAESKDPHADEAVDRDPRTVAVKPDSPAAVRAGGWRLKLYEYSLSLVLLALFLTSFALHALGGAAQYNEEQLLHHQPTVTLLGYLATSRFWFESFQNWQSEFLSIGMMVVLTIFLRQRGSPESKPVDAPHSVTGGE